jgi:hypothetical protein
MYFINVTAFNFPQCSHFLRICYGTDHKMWQQASKQINEYNGSINQHRMKTLEILICIFIVPFRYSPIIHISHHNRGTANIIVLQTMRVQPKYLQDEY